MESALLYVVMLLSCVGHCYSENTSTSGKRTLLIYTRICNAGSSEISIMHVRWPTHDRLLICRAYIAGYIRVSYVKNMVCGGYGYAKSITRLMKRRPASASTWSVSTAWL